MEQLVNIGKNTTLIAFEFEDGVIIGAESRSSDLQQMVVYNRYCDKLVQIREKIYCCGSGNQALLQNIISCMLNALYVYENHTGEEAHLSDVAKIFRNICLNNSSNENYGFIIAGFDRDHGAEVYSITKGMLHKEKLSVLGSGMDHIYGFIKKTYREGMSESESVNFAADAIKCAINTDPFSGGYINIAIIMNEAVERKIIYNTESGNAIDVM